MVTAVLRREGNEPVIIVLITPVGLTTRLSPLLSINAIAAGLPNESDSVLERAIVPSLIHQARIKCLFSSNGG